jgi:hypothetical protein
VDRDLQLAGPPPGLRTYGHRNRYGTGGENKLPEKARAEQRLVIDNNKAWRAHPPRMVWSYG